MTVDSAGMLRARGLRATPRRLALVAALGRRPHATAESVLADVRADVGAMSLQAAYDALDALVAVGLVRRIEPAGSPALFELRVGDNHHHLVCRGCGSVADVDCAVGAAPCLTAADDAGFEVDEAEVVYWGRCPACQVRDRGAASAPRGQGGTDRAGAAAYDTTPDARANPSRATSDDLPSTAPQRQERTA